MKFDETDEFYKSAIEFVDAFNAVKGGIIVASDILAHSKNLLKEMLPKTYTKDNQFQLYLDGETHCNIWYEDDDLVAGEYYSEGIFPEPEPEKRHETEITIVYEHARYWNVIEEPRHLSKPDENPSVHFKIADLSYKEDENLTWIELWYYLVYYPSDATIQLQIPASINIDIYDPNDVLKNDMLGNESIGLFAVLYRRYYTILMKKLSEAVRGEFSIKEISMKDSIHKTRDILIANRKYANENKKEQL